MAMRSMLQTQLHHATPQQKPAIVAQITRPLEVDMPAAKAALKRCLDRFGHPHGPTESPVIR
jgi:hypothetical protein